MVLALGPVVVATVVAVVCSVLLKVFLDIDDDDVEVAITACSFAMTFWVNLVLGQVLHSIVITLYICYLEKTFEFLRFRPQICHKVSNELVKAYPSYRPPPEVNPEWSQLNSQREDDYVGVV